MPKTTYVDGVWTILHFNSTPEAYYMSHRVSGDMMMECCFCHQPVQVPYQDIGATQGFTCPHCGSKVVYATVPMTYNLGEAFDVRGGASAGYPLNTEGVMHIVLPANFIEFNEILLHIQGAPQPLVRYRSLMPFLSVLEEVVNRTYRAVTSLARYGHAPNLFYLSTVFLKYGRVVIPTLKGVERLNVLPRMLDFAATELESYLLQRYKGVLSEEQKAELSINLMDICTGFVADFVKKW